jgi:hypothetical protein
MKKMLLAAALLPCFVAAADFSAKQDFAGRSFAAGGGKGQKNQNLISASRKC